MIRIGRRIGENPGRNNVIPLISRPPRARGAAPARERARAVTGPGPLHPPDRLQAGPLRQLSAAWSVGGPSIPAKGSSPERTSLRSD